MRTLLIAAPLMLLATPGWSASIRVYEAPSVVAGFYVYTFAIETEPGEVLHGVDARITGDLRQVNILGMPTVFTDLNPFFSFVDEETSGDSQFLFRNDDVLVTSAEESDTHLEASFSGLSLLNLPNPTPIAQIATADVLSIHAFFALDLGGAQPDVFQGSIWDLSCPPPCPEPTAAVLAALALGVAIRPRR